MQRGLEMTYEDGYGDVDNDYDTLFWSEQVRTLDHIIIDFMLAKSRERSSLLCVLQQCSKCSSLISRVAYIQQAAFRASQA